MPIGIALSGGGTKGSFEIGAVRALFNRRVRPAIITGTSVGGINAVKLAEDSSGDGALSELEAIWLDLVNDSDMYVEDPTIAELSQVMKDVLRYNYIKLAYDVVSFTVNPAMGWVSLIGDAIPALITGAELVDVATKISKLKSLYRLDPIRAKLSASLDPQKVASSGIKLRLAMVSLESGKVRFVDERSRFLDDDSPVDLVGAAIASSSIPVIFPPQKLGAENFVDGGVRNMIPIQAALDAGADKVFAIIASRAGVDPSTSFDSKTILDIGLRATTDIMPDQLSSFLTNPAGQGWQNNIVFIQPGVAVHDSLTVDPGLIRINRDYGYMKAAEEFDFGQSVNDWWTLLHYVMLSDLSNQIASLRKQIWETEYQASGELPLGTRVTNSQLIGVPDAGSFVRVRDMKKQLKILVEERMQLYGAVPNIQVSATSVDFGQVPICQRATKFVTVQNTTDFGTPPNIDSLWLEFEAHPWSSYANSPWGLFVAAASADHDVPPETPPAPAVLPSADLQLALAWTAVGPFTVALLTTTVSPGQSVDIFFGFTPSLGVQQATLTISSNDPNNAAIQIQLTGQGVDAPAAIAVSPTALYFGLIPPGGTRTQTVNISNTGCHTLTITAISITGGPFTALNVSVPMSIAPGARIVVSVRFHPQLADVYDGVMAITSNAQQPITSVPLNGSGFVRGSGLRMIAGRANITGAMGRVSSRLTELAAAQNNAAPVVPVDTKAVRKRPTKVRKGARGGTRTRNRGGRT